MNKILSTIYMAAFVLAAGAGKVQAQTTPVLDTTVADGYLSIIAPTCANFIKLLEADGQQFKNVLLKHKYGKDEKEREGVYKIESFQATYTIYKGANEVEFYLSTMAGSLKTIKADIKKRFPGAKITGEGTETETYEFETKDATGQHAYLFIIDSNNGDKVYMNMMKMF